MPGPRLIETPAIITNATDGDNIMGISPEVPSIQPSSLRGLRFPSLQETSPFQMPTDQQHWFSMQTKIETDAPKLTNAILSMYKVFRTAFLIYKKEDQGIQKMVDLISVKARQGLAIHLKMEIPIFLMLTVKVCMQKLDTFIKLENISNYRVILQSCHMNPVKNKQVNCDNIHQCQALA